MRPYKNLDRDTGVVAYEAYKDSITVKFRDGSLYLYTIKSAGALAISIMKKLAQKGEGLTTYITQNVRERFEAKLI
jgi:hypothetical protein